MLLFPPSKRIVRHSNILLSIKHARKIFSMLLKIFFQLLQYVKEYLSEKEEEDWKFYDAVLQHY